jgi:hypothetical protein
MNNIKWKYLENKYFYLILYLKIFGLLFYFLL